MAGNTDHTALLGAALSRRMVIASAGANVLVLDGPGVSSGRAVEAADFLVWVNPGPEDLRDLFHGRPVLVITTVGPAAGRATSA